MHTKMYCAAEKAALGINCKGEWEFWNSRGYAQYIMAHGEHLSDKLAEYASHCLSNYDGTDHYWSREDVVKALHEAKVDIPACMTYGDVHYLANKTYAKYAGGYLKTDKEVLELVAYKLKIKARHGDMSFIKLMSKYMKQGHPIDFCKMK